MFQGKEIRILLKGQGKESYLRLKNNKDNNSKMILKSFERIKEILKINPQYGDPISKKLIPKKYLKENIQNLYRVEMPNYWRMIYTLEGDVIEIFVFVLNIFNHEEYNKLFGYKKR